tara:strand:+ start:1141 stop:1398 length:258 start_codon:yes stop_codon:yes gene_type:complete
VKSSVRSTTRQKRNRRADLAFAESAFQNLALENTAFEDMALIVFMLVTICPKPDGPLSGMPSRNPLANPKPVGEAEKIENKTDLI